MKKTATVKIKGIKPLLFHSFNESALDNKKAKSGSAGNNPEEWKQTVIMDDKRYLYLPASYLFASIREGGRYSKIGRGNIIKHVIASLEITPARIYLNNLQVPEERDLTRDPTKPVYLDVRSVVNPMTKGRNLRYRIGASAGWECEFLVTWDDNILSKVQMEQVTRDGGLMSGTGCGRAIGLGRFEVVEFKEN